MAALNTNTRYLHAVARRRTRAGWPRRCPTRCRVCFFVNSGSEANDLALRLARAHTGRDDVLVLDHAYHGNLSVADRRLSPYKFDRPGGRGGPPRASSAIADAYRGRCGDDGAAVRRATSLTAASGAAGAAGVLRRVAARLRRARSCCPPGYLAAAFAHVRAAGGVCIADEVQVGFGRVGTHFWGFETQGVVPDIVTMGKPIGNGHPLGAVVTTPEIAALVRERHGVLQHLRRQPGLGRDRPGRARRDPRRAPAGARARGSASGSAPACARCCRAPADRRRARPRALPRRRAVRDRATREPATAEAAAVKEAREGAQGSCSRPTGPTTTCSRSSRRW